VLAVGHGGGDEATALRQARENARSRMVAQACAGLAEARCDGVARHVRDWKSGTYAAESGSVCATAAVARKHVEQLERDTAALKSSLAKLTKAIAAAAGEQTVAVKLPVWASRYCEGGTVGAVLRSQVRNAVVDRGGILLVDRKAAALDVGMTMAPSGEKITVTATIGEKALPGFEVPLDVLGIPRMPDPLCSDDGPPRPWPATGTVVVGGVERVETHWIGSCENDDFDSALMAANAMSSADERGRIGTLIATYRADASKLCSQYERFAIGTEAYAQRSDELARWAREVQGQILAGGAVRKDVATSEKLTLEVEAMRSNGDKLSSGDVVTKGDRFELRAKMTTDAYLYVLYENSAGEKALIPDDGSAVRVAANSWAPLPLAGFEFQVDGNAGRAEVVYVVASPTKIPLADLQPANLSRKFQPRGLTVVKKPVVAASGDNAAFYGDPEGTVSGFGGVLYTLALDHR